MERMVEDYSNLKFSLIEPDIFLNYDDLLSNYNFDPLKQ